MKTLDIKEYVLFLTENNSDFKFGRLNSHSTNWLCASLGDRKLCDFKIPYTGNYPERFEISLYFTSIFNINMLAAKIPHRIFEDDFALYYDC